MIGLLNAPMPYQYVCDAAKLLEDCLEDLQGVLKVARPCQSKDLIEMQDTLKATKALLFEYFQRLIDCEKSRIPSNTFETLHAISPPSSSLLSSAKLLKSIVQASSKQQREPPSHSYCRERNTTDTLLFRLIVALQLCQVRIDDALFVLTGKRKQQTQQSSLWRIVTFTTSSVIALAILKHQYKDRSERNDTRFLMVTATKVGLASASLAWVRRKGNHLWMASKIINSTAALEDWNRQWKLIQSTARQIETDIDEDDVEESMDRIQSKILVEYALKQPKKTSFWLSQGELRFLMLKRAMDVFYASVGTAMEVAKGHSEPDWQITLATAAAASFYSLTGASNRAALATSTSKSTRDLLRNAWGMVSLPAIKNLSLQASRILKGASVADRIELCGVSCFVLSKDPAPELAAATESFHRNYYQKKQVHTLSTINEESEHMPSPSRCSAPFARSISPHRQRDVIFHLTGGGFFAHIIASDLPYLLDWSASTGAVVICPEYALLPDHAFPDALNQITEVYKTLVSGKADSSLGFEVNRIVVTGESAGGNLAAALCVKLCLSPEVTQPMNGGSPLEEESDLPALVGRIPLPNALMLSCPVLNLSLELSHSRVMGTHDPVLRSGVLDVISDAYVPPSLSKAHPLVSPFFADDIILSKFPPTLLYASSNDPLLDDSVVFNQRLRRVGVESQLRAAQNMPHAYLGLGTAGFPEAVQVQEECQRWLAYQLSREIPGSETDKSAVQKFEGNAPI